jgi:hypothetical protein
VLEINVSSKKLSSQCNLTAQVEPVEDKTEKKEKKEEIE